MYEPKWVHVFRHYALPLWYLIYSYMQIIKFYDPNRDYANEEHSFCGSLWIWSFRLHIWPPIVTASYMCLTILFYKTPPVVDGKDDKDEVIEKVKVDNLVFRIVTIGNYRKMVENAILYHSDLLKKYLNIRFYSVHLLTEKPMNLDRVFPGIVKEIVVPKGYQAKTGSLGKARNLAYWKETKQLGDLPEDRTWILDIDEDVILTKSFMKALCTKFLKGKNEKKIGLPQVIIKFNEDTGYLNKLLQVHRFSFDLALHWPSLGVMNWAPMLAHGGCFIARADCSMDNNAECGTFCSISDDNAYILAMRSKNVKLEYIDGWFYEDAPPSFWTAVMQRVRWQRGHLYLALFSPVPWRMKIGVLIAWMDGCVLLPTLFLARMLLQWAEKNGHCQIIGIDNTYVLCLLAWMFATHTFTLIYGSWYVLSWEDAILFSLFTLTDIPFLILLYIGAATPFLSIGTALKEMTSGKLSWKVTEKSDMK